MEHYSGDCNSGECKMNEIIDFVREQIEKALAEQKGMDIFKGDVLYERGWDDCKAKIFKKLPEAWNICLEEIKKLLNLKGE